MHSNSPSPLSYSPILHNILLLYNFSPRLAACAADLSFMFPSFAVSFGLVCQLITSALACWPLYNWTPGLFHCLLENVEPTNASVPLGPKDACSLLCLLVSHLFMLVSLVSFRYLLVSIKKRRWQNCKIGTDSHLCMFLVLEG